MKWVNPYWSVNDAPERKIGEMVIDGETIQTWPTNDGGYWYYNKEGRVVIVNE